MKNQFITLHSYIDESEIYIHRDVIGHIYVVKEMIVNGKVASKGYTIVGTTHNNGEFRVKETPQKIFNKIY
jgi:hypothetical protein